MMTKFWTKIKSWFHLKPAKKKRILQPKITKTRSAQAANYQPINHQHYRQFIGKVAKRAIAEQRARQRRNL